MKDDQFRRRAEIILHNMAVERKGFWNQFKRGGRWLIRDEPLRNDAADLLRDASVRMPMREGEQYVGEKP